MEIVSHGGESVCVWDTPEGNHCVPFFFSWSLLNDEEQEGGENPALLSGFWINLSHFTVLGGGGFTVRHPVWASKYHFLTSEISSHRHGSAFVIFLAQVRGPEKRCSRTFERKLKWHKLCHSKERKVKSPEIQDFPVLSSVFISKATNWFMHRCYVPFTSDIPQLEMNFNYSSKHTDVKTTGVKKMINQKLLENVTVN